MYISFIVSSLKTIISLENYKNVILYFSNNWIISDFKTRKEKKVFYEDKHGISCILYVIVYKEKKLENIKKL